MLEFIIGRVGTGKSTYCLNAVKEKLHKSPKGMPLIILVPDHMTFAIERQLALELQDIGGFSRAYVLGISRLAYQILLRCGGALHPHLNEIGKQLLLSRVLSYAKLSILAKVARQNHFTSEVNKIIEEFKTSGISANELENLLQYIDDESLKQKLTDLTAIYHGLNEQMKGHYHDSEDILSLAIEKIANCSWLEGAEIWIDGFDAFNPQHLNLIEQLLKKVANMHLTLCIDDVLSVEYEAPVSLFHRQYIAYRQINQIATKQQINTKIHALTKNHRHQKQSLSFIEEQLFKFPLTAKDYEDGVHIVEVANRRLECEAVATDILRLCREENYRHYDIGILIRGTKEYSELLQAVLNDYKIPFFSDQKRQSSHHPLAELIRSSLEAIRTWQYEPLFRAFKTDFFNTVITAKKNNEIDEVNQEDIENTIITRQEIDYLENYVLSFGIHGYNRWSEESDWQFTKNNRIDSEELPLEEKDSLELINKIRRQLVKPLSKFYQSIKDAQTVKDFTLKLYDFLIDIDVPHKLSQKSKSAQEAKDIALAKEHQQIWNNIVELMEQMVQTCGEDIISLKNYEQLINDGLDSIQIALIPPGYDYITLASFEHNTLNNKKAIYIVGANEKLIPKTGKNEGLLTDAERLFMIEQGLNISSGTLEDSFAERYLLYKGFTLATDYLWVSYALADEEGNGQNKSILVSRLRQILPRAKFTSIPLETIQQSHNFQLTSKRRSLSHLVLALRKLKENQQWDEYWQDVYNYLLEDAKINPHENLPILTAINGIFAKAPQEVLPQELASKLYTNRKLLHGSITRFEQFFNCPFKHFAHYALNLQERKEFNFAAPDLGILLHAIMHKFGDYLANNNRSWQSISQQECNDICEDIVAKLAPRLQNQILLSSNRYKHLLARIKELAVGSLLRLIDFAKHSQFEPKAFEQNFGLKSKMPPLLLDDDNGHKIEITGQIDRIDISDNYYLVIDYKSGNAFINLLEVYYGLKLQLLTYLLVAKNATNNLYNLKNAIPAGILYCFLKTPQLTSKVKLSSEQVKEEAQKQMRMPGWVLADSNIIRKIDDSLHFIKVKLNKDNTISSNSKTYVKSFEEFELLMNHIELTLKQAGTRILQGETSIYPYKIKETTACKYCPYLAVCRFDKHVEGYNYHEIAEQNDSNIIELLQKELTAIKKEEEEN